MVVAQEELGGEDRLAGVWHPLSPKHIPEAAGPTSCRLPWRPGRAQGRRLTVRVAANPLALLGAVARPAQGPRRT